MISQHTFVNPASVDTTDLSAIRLSARNNSPDALRQAAQQFEALFMNMVLKSMRKTTFDSGLFNNSQSKMYTSILDQELSQAFAKRGMGLADALVQQMQNNNRALPSGSMNTPKSDTVIENKVGKVESTGVRAMQMAASLNKAFMIGSLTQRSSEDSSDKGVLSSMLATYQRQQEMISSDLKHQDLINLIQTRQAELDTQQVQLQNEASRPAHVQAFMDKLKPYADEVSRETGIPANFMLAQAALETGWGEKEITMGDGTPSYNLFGIKAGRSWGGEVAMSVTTEYENGVAAKTREPFRAYASYAESFKDYASLISTNPRYQRVLENGGDAVAFAQSLQDAGYATDPQYATKLARIIQHSLSA